MLNQKILQEIRHIIFRFLNPREYKVFIFGSRALGSGRKFSDIDIGIEGDQPMPSHMLMNIEEAFEESNIPYTVEVVDFSTVSDDFKKLALQKIKKLNQKQ